MSKIKFLLFFIILLNSSDIYSQSWIQIGSNIDGHGIETQIGSSLASNKDGSIVAVGEMLEGKYELIEVTSNSAVFRYSQKMYRITNDEDN